jgi:hypothetical protein
MSAASLSEAELLGKIERGEINVRAALGLDLSVIAKLIDKAFALIAVGKALQGEVLLFDLSQVVNLSYTLSFALGACRELQKDWFGAAAAYAEALVRAERAGAVASFMQQTHLAHARCLLAFGEIVRAQDEMKRVLVGPDPRLAEQARSWLAGSQKQGVLT